MSSLDLLQLCLWLSLASILLKPCSQEPMVRWGEGWNPTPTQLERWAARRRVKWGVRCGPELAALDFDSKDHFHSFLKVYLQANCLPRARTRQSYHLSVRPTKSMPKQRVNCVEVKCIGSYVGALLCVHHSCVRHTFEVHLDSALPEVNLDDLLGLGPIDSSRCASSYESTRHAASGQCAPRCDQRQYPDSLYGPARRVLSHSNGKMKHSVIMRDWKWNCPECALLLKRYWLKKTEAFSFRFMLRLPTSARPAKSLCSLAKPRYIHIVANGEGWAPGYDLSRLRL